MPFVQSQKPGGHHKSNPLYRRWADVYPFLYFLTAFEGLKVNQLAKHLVIDEMQDYTTAQYAVINKLFSCQKTILGDLGQAIHPYHSLSLDDFRKLYSRPEVVTLTKSYRSTYEIMSFAKSDTGNSP